MAVPFVIGMGKSCRNIYRKYGIEMHFREGSTIKDLLVHPKDRDSILQKSGVIYNYKCSRVDCEEEYLGESGRTFAERFREHMKAPSPFHDHYKPLVMTYPLKISALWAERTKVLLDPSKKQF